MHFIPVANGYLNLANIDKVTYDIRTNSHTFEIIHLDDNSYVQRSTHSKITTGCEVYSEILPDRSCRKVATAEGYSGYPHSYDVSNRAATGDLELLAKLIEKPPVTFTETDYIADIQFKKADVLIHSYQLATTHTQYNNTFTEQISTADLGAPEAQALAHIADIINVEPINL